MTNEDFYKGMIDQMVKIVEFQTLIGEKINRLDTEIKALQDSVADALNNRRTNVQ
jgi:hypothetical protein